MSVSVYADRSVNRKLISDDEIAAAKSRRIEDVIGAYATIKRDFANCPIHGPEKTPSLHIIRRTNRWHCFGCGVGGDAIAFVRQLKGLDFADAVRELANSEMLRGSLKKQNVTPAPVQGRSATTLILDLWRGASAPNIARYYLDTRGLRLKSLPDAIRGHKAVLWCEEVGSERPPPEPEFRAWWLHQTRSWWRGIERPAMLAAISDDAGNITAIQRTWTTLRLEYDGITAYPKGAKASDLSAGKKCLGRLGSGAVRLVPAGEVLGIAEGVETALAVSRLFKLPCWATCGAGRLGSITVPPEVRHIIIFADRGDAGYAAAAKAEAAYRQRGYGCQVEFPDPAHKDFAEQLRLP